MNDRTWHDNMLADLVVAGLAERTQEAYLRAVRQLCQIYGGRPRWVMCDRQMTLPAFEFLRRFLQHVLPCRLQKIRHYGFLSRRSKIELDDVRDVILESLSEVEPDLELQDWSVPALRCMSDDGPKCPDCGGQLEFVSFHRIRPPPLTLRQSHPPESCHSP